MSFLPFRGFCGFSETPPPFPRERRAAYGRLALPVMRAGTSLKIAVRASE